MKVRPFQLSDTEAVVELWRRCGLLRSWNDPRRDITRKVTVQPELFLVGEVGEKVMASIMAGYDGHRGGVYYVAVDPAHQRQGHGRTLMATVETRLNAMGCPKLNVMVRTDNHATRAFYAKLGYASSAVECLGKRLVADD